MNDIWHFILKQGGTIVAEGDGPHNHVEREAMHYVSQYVYDDEVTLTLSPGPLPEPRP